jgi:hypothetical protein
VRVVERLCFVTTNAFDLNYVERGARNRNGLTRVGRDHGTYSGHRSTRPLPLWLGSSSQHHHHHHHPPLRFCVCFSLWVKGRVMHPLQRDVRVTQVPTQVHPRLSLHDDEQCYLVLCRWILSQVQPIHHHLHLLLRDHHLLPPTPLLLVPFLANVT